MIIALHTHQIDISPLVDEKPIEDPVGQPSAGVPVLSGTQPAASFLRIFDAKRPVVFFGALSCHWLQTFSNMCAPKFVEPQNAELLEK